MLTCFQFTHKIRIIIYFRHSKTSYKSYFLILLYHISLYHNVNANKITKIHITFHDRHEKNHHRFPLFYTNIQSNILISYQIILLYKQNSNHSLYASLSILIFPKTFLTSYYIVTLSCYTSRTTRTNFILPLRIVHSTHDTSSNSHSLETLSIPTKLNSHHTIKKLSAHLSRAVFLAFLRPIT